MGARITTPPYRPITLVHGFLYSIGIQWTIPDSIWTLVELDTIGAGYTDAIEDTVNHRIIVPEAGFYLVKGQTLFSTVTDGRKFELRIFEDGADLRVRSVCHSGLADGVSISTGSNIYLHAGAYVDLWVQHNCAILPELQGGHAITFLAVQRVR